MLAPLFSKMLIDQAYPAGNIPLMQVLVIGMFAFGVLNTFTGAIQALYSGIVTVELNNSVALYFFNHLQHLPIRFFEEHRTGDVMSRFADVRKSINAVTQVLETVLLQGAYLIWAPVLLLYLNPRLASIVLLTLPAGVLLTTLSTRPMRNAARRSIEAYADVSSVEYEAVAQIRTIKSLNAEGHVFNRVRGQMDHAVGTDMHANVIAQVVRVINGVVTGCITAVYTYFGWKMVLTGEMSLGSLIAFTVYVGFLYGPLSRALGMYRDFQQAAVSIQRMFEFLDRTTEQPVVNEQWQATMPAKTLSGCIVLQSLSFCYRAGQPVLKHISCSIEPAMHIAVVGASGCGKSTLLKLLAGMETPSEGTISFNRRDSKEIPVRQWRDHVTMVWQEPGMFRGTMWENLTIGIPDATPAKVDAAVRAASIDELIDSLPEGIHSQVGEGGCTLSGGQRQRIAIARALIREAPVLLLDEPTAALDRQTESALLSGLAVITCGITVIYATHRIAAARRADRILMLNQGELIAFGTHEALLATSEAYRLMFNEQEAHVVEDASTEGLSLVSA